MCVCVCVHTLDKFACFKTIPQYSSIDNRFVCGFPVFLSTAAVKSRSFLMFVEGHNCKSEILFNLKRLSLKSILFKLAQLNESL